MCTDVEEIPVNFRSLIQIHTKTGSRRMIALAPQRIFDKMKEGV
jgi:hypothetical protein